MGFCVRLDDLIFRFGDLILRSCHARTVPDTMDQTYKWRESSDWSAFPFTGLKITELSGAVIAQLTVSFVTSFLS